MAPQNHWKYKTSSVSCRCHRIRRGEGPPGRFGVPLHCLQATAYRVGDEATTSQGSGERLDQESGTEYVGRVPRARTTSRLDFSRQLPQRIRDGRQTAKRDGLSTLLATPLI